MCVCVCVCVCVFVFVLLKFFLIKKTPILEQKNKTNFLKIKIMKLKHASLLVKHNGKVCNETSFVFVFLQAKISIHI